MFVIVLYVENILFSCGVVVSGDVFEKFVGYDFKGAFH